MASMGVFLWELSTIAGTVWDIIFDNGFGVGNGGVEFFHPFWVKKKTINFIITFKLNSLK